LWEFPRRSIDGYTKRNIGGWWGTSKISLKENLSWDEMECMLMPLFEQDENSLISVV